MLTSAQEEARQCNWKIFSIRGIYTTVLKLDIPIDIKVDILTGLDRVLDYYGAVPELEHRRIMLNNPTYEIEL